MFVIIWLNRKSTNTREGKGVKKKGRGSSFQREQRDFLKTMKAVNQLMRILRRCHEVWQVFWRTGAQVMGAMSLAYK